MSSLAEPQFEDLMEVIADVWGFAELRPLQEPALRAFISGRDSLVVLPTGGGKSLCYQAPAAYLSKLGMGTTVVISPLIALMKDQVDALREVGVSASQLDSSLGPEERRATAEALKNGELAMLFVSPERLVGGGDAFAEMLREAGVKNFAIDEAHCISSWGHDFRPEYRKLAGLKEMFPGARVHAFTATATERVRKDIVHQLALEDPEILVGNFDRPNLTYRILPRREMLKQIEEILDRHKDEAGIIYCLRRKDVDELSAALAQKKQLGRTVMGYHAGMTPLQRRKAQEAFIDERCDTIVATVAFGMGIDRSNIRFVIHAGMPKSIEAYQQETGRAGRDGLEAECVLLYSAQDSVTSRMLVQKSANDARHEGVEVDPAYVESALKHIDEMDRFARGATCRHKALVEYFCQQYERPGSKAEGSAGCGACDMCLGDTTAVEDSKIIAQKILSCVARTEQRFGVAHIIAVLRGENTEGIRKWRHEKLSVYGLLQEHSKAELRDFIYQLVGQGALLMENLALASGMTVPILKLNAASVEVMKANREVRLVQIVRKTAGEARRTRGDAVSWDGVDRDLFEALRQWRKSIAAQRAVPPYVIFSDATLRELARARPSTMRSLRGIYGVGEKKMHDLGGAILPLIKTHCEARNLEMDMKVSAESSPNDDEPAPLNASRREAFGYFKLGQSVDEVAKKMQRARSTTEQYLVEYIAAEKPASVMAWVTAEDYKRVEGAYGKIGGGRLKELFLELEEKVPYGVIRVVAAHLRVKGPRD